MANIDNGTELSAPPFNPNFPYGLTPYSFGALGDGATDDSVALQSWLYSGGSLYLPKARFLHTQTLLIQNNTRIQGAFMVPNASSGSVLYYTGTSDQCQIANPINVNTAANITISDVCFKSLTKTAGKANLASVGSSFVRTYRCAFSGQDYGIIHDQDELSVDEDNVFFPPAAFTACIWLVNGAQHTVGGNPFLTNANVINRCEFSSNGTGVGVADDGGSNHIITNNNFSQLATAVRVNASSGLIITGNEFDTSATAAVSFNLTKIGGAGGAISVGVNVSANTMSVKGLVFVASSVNGLNYTANEYFTAGACDNLGAVQAFPNGSSFIGQGNIQVSGGSSPTNNFNLSGTFVPTWNATGTAPALGNGTISGSYIRNGSSVTVDITLNIGSTSTFGTGNYNFANLPFPVAGSDLLIGTIMGFQSSSGNFYVMAARLAAGGVAISGRVNGASAQFGQLSPVTWASGDVINVQITYPTFDYK